MAHEQANYFQKFNTTSSVLSRLVCFLLPIHHWRDNTPGFFFFFLWLTISLSHIRMAFNLHFSHALRLAEQSVHIWIIVWILHLISLCFTSCALNLGKILRPLTVNRTSADFTACDVSCYGDSIINIFPSLTVLWFLQAYVWRIDVFPSGRWSTHNIEARNNSWRDPCQQEDIYRSLFHG